MLLVLICLTILFMLIPEKYWSLLYLYINNKFIDIRSHIPRTEVMNGQGLIEFMTLSNSSNSITLKSEEIKGKIPCYKFYTRLVLDLYHARRVLGAEINKLLFDVKINIVEDLQFEKKVSSQVTNARGQFFAMSLLTWGFIFLTSKMIGHKPSSFICMVILSLQLLGGACFSFFYSLIKQKTLNEINEFISPIYGFKSLLSVGLPISVICEKIEVQKLWSLKEKNLKNLVERLFFGIEDLKNKGVPLTRTLDELLNEVQFLREQKFQKFIALVLFMKFLVLAFFYLTSYFIFIITLFTSLMAHL